MKGHALGCQNTRFLWSRRQPKSGAGLLPGRTGEELLLTNRFFVGRTAILVHPAEADSLGSHLPHFMCHHPQSGVANGTKLR